MNFLGNGGRSLLGGEGIGVSCGDIENKKKEKKRGISNHHHPHR